MDFKKNLPRGERGVRVVLGALVGVGGVVGAFLGQPLWGILVAASGFGTAATGLTGWCPMCAAVGRTLPETEHKIAVGKL